MKQVLLFALLVPALSGCTTAEAPPTASGGQSFRAFVPQWEAAQSGFINGDPTLWKRKASHREDATIFGAFGGREKGWKEVGERYDWASSQFKHSGASQKIEYLNTGVSGDLAFTVTIERQEQVRMGGREQPAPRALRVTQLFRREDGAWKLLHRHADPLVERLRPDARR